MKRCVSIGFALLMAVTGAPQVWAHGGGGMGGITDNDLCSMEKGQYLIHFSAYQHSTTGASAKLAVLKELKEADLRRYVDAMKEEFQSYCRDIPKTGKATLTFDLISDALRRIPVAVRVVEASEREGGETVLYIPQQVYPAGVVRAETDFGKAGKYKAVLEVEDPAARSRVGGASPDAVSHSHDGTDQHTSTAEEEAYHAHDSAFSFPFTVGLKTPRGGGARGPSMMRNPAIIVMAVAGVGLGTVLYVRRKKKAASSI